MHARQKTNMTTRLSGVDPDVRAALDQTLLAELALVRVELQRVDTKAAPPLAASITLLTGALTILSSGRVPTVAAPLGWMAVAAFLIAVKLAFSVAHPRLDGGFGFVRWARYDSTAAVLDDLSTELSTGEWTGQQADQLRWLSRATRRKYRKLGWSMTLLLVGLLSAAIAAGTTWWAL